MLDRLSRYQDAIAAFEEAIRLEPDFAYAYTELAILLSNCPDLHIRDPRRAVQLADHAVELYPGNSNNWMALGVARYRNGEWREARSALDKALKVGPLSLMSYWLRPLETKAMIRFFLAMCHWQLGQEVEARKCYELAVQLREQQPVHDEQLDRIRAEAAELLKISNTTE